MCKHKTEVYSRVVGYYRPVQQWNRGKQAEYKDRVAFKVNSKSFAKVEKVNSKPFAKVETVIDTESKADHAVQTA